LGFDAREVTPQMVKRACCAAAESRSFTKAATLLDDVGGQPLSAKSIERIVHDVGRELAERRDADPKRNEALAQRPEEPPELAVVQADGGRMRTRTPGHGPGVHLAGEGWRETKNACLMKAKRQTFSEDPQPDPPASFCDPQQVAKITEMEALSVAAAPPSDAPPETEEAAEQPSDWRPRPLLRTLLASLAKADVFGRQMRREAQRRRFYEALARAYLGDGLPWNWSIWRKCFPSFTPILDFIHPLSYLHLAAKSLYPTSASDAWEQYLVWMRGCWQGEVGQVIAELKHWQTKLGNPPRDAGATDPCQIVAKTITYLSNNTSKMNYPEYRRQGLPITTAWMESAVKEMNLRVKGTEMFWNDPEGAEGGARES
jgi:hypothetical protein